METHDFLFDLLVILLAARICTELATRLQSPSVIGELCAGIVLGPSLLGWMEPVESIRLLAEIVPFVVKGVLLPPNREDIGTFEAWASTIPWMDDPPSYSMFFDLHCRRNTNKNQIIQQLRSAPREGIEFLARRKAAYLKEMKEFCSRFMGPSGYKLFSCGAGMGGACLDAYGKLQLCLGLRHPDTVYDLKKGSLFEAISPFIPQVREMKATHPEYLSRCARCFLKGLCKQCPGKSWTEQYPTRSPIAAPEP